jgi:hypothetical protein
MASQRKHVSGITIWRGECIWCELCEHSIRDGDLIFYTVLDDLRICEFCKDNYIRDTEDE